MSLKSTAAKLFAKIVSRDTKKWTDNPIETKGNIFQELVSKASDTVFGKDHNFQKITSHREFAENVPFRDDKALRPYVDRVVAVVCYILWPGNSLYFAKTSGT